MPEGGIVKHWHQMNAISALADRKFDFAAIVGQHPMAGTIGGHPPHGETWGL